ncbi:DedA family protein [Roseibium aggregatum]|uniref:DedA family protein n=1 Tax=Roseibium aggregatum TaxID=187304 RepID=A0A926NX06_9HYPH|nr:DedA family protein [Roseibium aggregatum]MBD1548922.1 DedA family protein [Roseibium aggregatum]
MIPFTSQVLDVIHQYGAPGVFAVVGLEALGLPVPGETAIIAAAAAAGAGGLNIYLVGVAAILGAILGDNIGYLIGWRYGRVFIERHGAKFGVSQEKYAKAERLAERYGFAMVLFARFVVLLRQLNGLVAGSTGMHWAVFFLANAIGAVLWVGTWATIAYVFGESVAGLALPWILHHLVYVGGAAVFLAILALLVFGRDRWLHVFRRKR